MMADPEPIAGIFQWDLEAWQTMIAGAIGGLFLCLGRFVATLPRITGQQAKMKQYLLAHIPPLIVLPVLGGGLAWLTIGASGAFLTGLGALGFILLATGPHNDAEDRREAADDVPTSD